MRPRAASTVSWPYVAGWLEAIKTAPTTAKRVSVAMLSKSSPIRACRPNATYQPRRARRAGGCMRMLGRTLPGRQHSGAERARIRERGPDLRGPLHRRYRDPDRRATSILEPRIGPSHIEQEP